MAYNLYWIWHPRGARAVPAHRRRILAALPDAGADHPGAAQLVRHARRHRPDGRVQDVARPVRPLRRQRLGPLVPAPARRGFRRPDRLLLRRVRAPRIARHLLRWPRRTRRRPPEGSLRHGPPLRRGRALLPARLLPTDHRCRRPPGARLPRLRPVAAAGQARRDRTAARSIRRWSCPAGRSGAPSGWRRWVACRCCCSTPTSPTTTTPTGRSPTSCTCAAARCACTRRSCSAWAACAPCARWASTRRSGTSTRATPAFLLVEQARELVAGGCTSTTPCTEVKRNAVFTIHTPVSAGNERFDAGPRPDAGRAAARRDVEPERIVDLGRGVDDAGQFDMTAFSLRLTNGANAVSQLHGHRQLHVADSVGRSRSWPSPTASTRPPGSASRSASCTSSSAATSTSSTTSTSRALLGAHRTDPRRAAVGGTPAPEAGAGLLRSRAGCSRQFAATAIAAPARELSNVLDPAC